MLDVIKAVLNLLQTAFLSSKTTRIPTKNEEKTSETSPPPPPVAKPLMAIEITAYFDDPKNGTDRRLQYPADYTNEILTNAQDLLDRVNALLLDLGLFGATVSSGWRPSGVNAKIGGATRSLHMQGKAVDLRDSAGEIKKLIEQNPGLLTKHGLWMENSQYTPIWCHLDTGVRRDRPVRIFIP